MFTISEISKEIRNELKLLYPPEEIQSFTYLIFDHLLNYTKIFLHTNSDTELHNNYVIQIREITAKLKVYQPIQYILQTAFFYDMNLSVSPDVLIPRPETEELVNLIISENNNKTGFILDIGTGSGCIAIALAKYLPKMKVSAIDISEKAIDVASKNAKMQNVEVTFWIKNILLNNLNSDRYDIIVSNPPYVMNKEKQLMNSNVLDYEPALALFVPDINPLLFYDAIAKYAKNNLNENGLLYLEINENLSSETASLLANYQFKDIAIIQDINGKNRMIKARKLS